MNGVLSFALAVLIYPGLLVTVVAGVALLMVRAVAGGAAGGEKSDLLADLRESWQGETIVPDGVSESALTLSSVVAIATTLLSVSADSLTPSGTIVSPCQDSRRSARRSLFSPPAAPPATARTMSSATPATTVTSKPG